MGTARDGGQMNKICIEDCVSPPYVETFKSKLIKKVSYLNKKSLRVFEFRDSYVLYMFYRYEHYMSILRMALIVAIVHLDGQFLKACKK